MLFFLNHGYRVIAHDRRGQDVALFIGKLAGKGKTVHALRKDCHAWIQLIEGDLDMNGEKLLAGDGASVDEEKDLRFASEKGAHFLLFDLN
jgi:redox-sensitive bicupin YhaK (pirin superfamily)